MKVGPVRVVRTTTKQVWWPPIHRCDVECDCEYPGRPLYLNWLRLVVHR